MANVKELREKIAARKAQRAAEQKSRYAKMRAVAEKAPEKLEKCLAGLADKCASMAEGWENLRENLGLLKAAKEAPLRVRIATARSYAKNFKRIAEESPEKMAEALQEAYQGLNDIAADIELAADQMGIELEQAPMELGGELEIADGAPESFETEVAESIVEEAEAENESPEHELMEKAEGEEHEEEPEEEKEASGSEPWVTDRDEAGQPKAPELADVPRVAGSGSDGFVTDRDKSAEPDKPAKLDIPQAQGKAASSIAKYATQLKPLVKKAMSRKDYIILADAIRSFQMPNDMREKLARHMAQSLKRDNHAFSESIFVDYAMGRGGNRGGPKFKGDQPNVPETLFV